MKVRRLYVGLIIRNDVEKLVLLKQSSIFKKIIKLALNDTDEEYKCVFTGKKYWLKRDVIESLAFFLDIDELTSHISKESLRKLYPIKEAAIKKVLTNKKKAIGFK